MPSKKILLGCACVLLAIFCGIVLFGPSNPPHLAEPISEKKRIGQFETILPLPEAHTGDLDDMLERRIVRILVPYNKMLYFHDRGRERGLVHDAGVEFQKWLNRKYDNGKMPVKVVFIPSSREYLLQNLLDGLGDIAAGNLTITENREKIVDFTDPHPKPVDEIVVTGPSSPTIESIKDLANVTIYVRKSSSYFEHLTKLKEKLRIDLELIPADEILEDEDLLEMVNAGLLPLAIVDNHKAQFWSKVFKKIQLHDHLIVNKGGKIAWAVRKNSPKLVSELNEFRRVEGNRKGLANILLKRYLGSLKFAQNATDKNELAKFDALKGLFQKYANMYDLDPLLLMAQGFQESRLDHKVKSPAGAVGIMQILPSTAQSKPISIDGIEKDREQNIHAGAKYLRYLIDTYLSDSKIDATNKLLLALAAYNAGPGNLKKMRIKALEMGLDDNVWFKNVELASSQIIGRETVQYVSNIYKYYLAYRLVEEQRKVKENRHPT